MPNAKPYYVELWRNGRRRRVCFATMREGVDYCNAYFSRTGIVLGLFDKAVNP